LDLSGLLRLWFCPAMILSNSSFLTRNITFFLRMFEWRLISGSYSCAIPMGLQSTQVANDAGFARIFKNPRFSVDDCGLSAKLSYVNAKGEKSGGGGAGGGRGRGWVRRCEGGGWRLEDGGGGGEKKMEDGRWRGRARAKREDGGGKMADGKGAFWTLLQRSVCGFAGASPYRLPFHPFPQGQKGQNQGESR